jgi:hypothetical protein
MQFLGVLAPIARSSYQLLARMEQLSSHWMEFHEI